MKIDREVGRTSRFVPPNSVQTGTPMQVTSPHYFPTQPPTFYHQQGPMQPVPQYYDSTTTMQHSGGRVRKAITIRNTDSLKDVTDDILLSGKKSGGTSPSARFTTAPAIPSVPVQPSLETQIAADFAARVAKVATTNTADRSAGDVLPQVRSILKKLAPQRFIELMAEFQKLPINSEQNLKGVIDQIFEKTINKPELLYQCAKMCLTLSQLWSNCRVIVDIPGTSVQFQQQTAIVEFRKVLLTRCQREFEKDCQNENVLSKLRQQLEEATALETKQQCKEDLKVAEDEKRKRLLRNVRFFAELFKLKLLTESIMHTCIMSLLKDGDNESLEFICGLLTTIGKDLDHIKEESRIDEYFREIENLTREKRTSHCVRLMIPYLVNLRKNGWRKYQAQGR
ncbi:unnamed protein product [Clavelina lepadiformis]|uniref:MIF4G domain-containing protein n=1 Tax=Clavelina lepadiformis TaxID=159417 RepID=A0ABP0GM82_CLALP